MCYFGYMISRILNYPKNQSFLLFGPRGTGKSSWIQTHFKQAHLIDLLDSEVYQELLNSPRKLEARIPKPAPEWVIIDEVQKIPALLDEVHRLIENKKQKFILTGSSARKLKKAGTNLLAGRAIRLDMTPFHSIELKNQFNLKTALQQGMLPYAYLKDDSKKYLKSYVGTFLKEEIQQEALVRSLGNFSRFLEVASFSQASNLSVSNVAHDAGIGRKAAQGYFEILEDFLIAKRVPLFQGKATRKPTAHPKFYFFDVGVFRALRPTGPLDVDTEIEGLAFETLIYQELEGLKRVTDLDFDLSFWQSKKGKEIDFILYGKTTFTAIEVKSSPRVRDDDFIALNEFHELYPKSKCILIYTGTRSYQHHGIQVLSIHDYFENQKKWISGRFSEADPKKILSRS
jgi:predicted AAA+ superfamily ATPase